MNNESYITLADIKGDRSCQTSKRRPSSGWVDLLRGEDLIEKTHVLTYRDVFMMLLFFFLFFFFFTPDEER